jgi:regulator of protease activity HflC (stomatin/prohibitin superfamily)
MFSATVILIIAIFVVGILYSAVRILREYERGVVFTLGRYTGTKGPGFFLLVPIVQQMVRVDLRVIVDEVPPQDVISRDNVSVKVNAVIYFRVVDAERAVIQVNNYLAATSQLAQTTLRWVLGKHDLDSMLAERDKLNADIQDVLDKQTEAWGIKVSTVEIKRIDLNENMVRAIARQAEAERTRRAKVINAEGEQQAAQKLLDAAGSWHPFPRRCSSAIWPLCSTLRASEVRRSSSRSRWISCADGKRGCRREADIMRQANRASHETPGPTRWKLRIRFERVCLFPEPGHSLFG